MKNICVINFQLGRLVGEFLERSKRKGYKKLLTGKDTVPRAKEYEKAAAEGKKGDGIVRVNDLNDEAVEDIILSMYWSHYKTRKSYN